MYSIVDLTTQSVVSQKGQSGLVFHSLARVRYPDGSTGDGASVGDEVPASSDPDPPLFRLYRVAEVDAGAGPVVVSTSNPVFDPVADTVTVTRTLQAETAANIKKRTNSPILRAITELELSTLRSMRDSARGNGGVPDAQGKTSKQRLDDIETEITALRGTLVP